MFMQLYVVSLLSTLACQLSSAVILYPPPNVAVIRNKNAVVRFATNGSEPGPDFYKTNSSGEDDKILLDGTTLQDPVTYGLSRNQRNASYVEYELTINDAQPVDAVQYSLEDENGWTHQHKPIYFTDVIVLEIHPTVAAEIDEVNKTFLLHVNFTRWGAASVKVRCATQDGKEILPEQVLARSVNAIYFCAIADVTSRDVVNCRADILPRNAAACDGSCVHYFNNITRSMTLKAAATRKCQLTMRTSTASTASPVSPASAAHTAPGQFLAIFLFVIACASL